MTANKLQTAFHQGLLTMPEGEGTRRRRPFFRRLCPALLVVILLLGALLRVYGLGSRSLWADEFCTWHVSRMELGASLGWGPELTKPPLYQLCLRALTQEERPTEWVLRSPACAAGVLTILAVFALARVAGGVMTGLAAAGLLACSLRHIQYSQEARPYSMLVLGSTVSMLLWYGLVRKPTWAALCAYVIATALAFHANYLMSLVVLAQALWWVLSCRERLPERRSVAPLIAWVTTAAFCAPMVLHYLRSRSSLFQGLSWIKPPTWSGALELLEQITFGPIWVMAVLAPALVLWIVATRSASTLTPTLSSEGRGRPWARLRSRAVHGGADDLCRLLVVWLLCSWFGLLVISWVAHPAMVDRYALPAAIPALLIPLIVAHRLDRRLPMIIMVVFSALGLRDWARTRWEVEPGFRELSHYLAEAVDPRKDAVVLTIDRRTHPYWDDAERLPFQYYPVKDYPIEELHLAADGVTVMNDIFHDPRGMYLVVLWADPFAILNAAGREAELFSIEGQRYTQLLFSPYRLVRVAPLR